MSFYLISTGGIYRWESLSFQGEPALETVRRYHVGLAVLSRKARPYPYLSLQHDRLGGSAYMGLRHHNIIDKMDLAQKCALLSGVTAFGTRAYPSLGIPELQFSDGPHGMRHQGPNAANHLGVGGSIPATCFPTAVTVANSWDPALAEELGRALGEEAVDQGVNVVLGPGLCIKRSPLCGRNFEYLSEDPLLAGKMGAGYVRGIQSSGVSACPKHFAANSQETRRQASDSVLDERTLREIYLSAFETVVCEARPKTIMTSYNKVNGSYANENPHLLKDILRGEWGFEGAIVTDWGGSNDHVAGVAAGSTFEMPAPGLDSVRQLVKAVRAGELAEADVDARVDEAIELALSTAPAVKAAAGRQFDVDAHHELARRIAAEGVVLLKNEPASADKGQPADAGRPLLPLLPRTKVALIGDFAQNPRYQGAGSSLVNCTRLDTVVDAIGTSELKVLGFERGFDRTDSADDATDARLRNAAVALAQNAEVVLVCLGLDELAESEGLDRADMRLNQNQVKLLHALSEANGNVVVLLFAGSVVETDWAADARSILYLALGGQAGASAAVDVLTGRVNPSGKLAETWAKRLADTPTYDNFPSDGPVAAYREGIYVGYRYYQKASVPVAYPFGHGLSYTSFAFKDIELSEMNEVTSTSVSFDISNVGDVSGAEVAQLYVGKLRSKVFRPLRELKGFAKVLLEPGETRRVTIDLDERAFRYFNVQTGSWEVEGGLYTIEVGTSSEDIRLSARVNVAGTHARAPYEGLDLTPYETGRVRQVDDAHFAALLGRDVPDERFRIDRNVCFRDVGKSRSPLFWAIGALLRSLRRRSRKSGTPDLNIEFIYNMPMRALAKNAGQFVSMGLVDAIVRELKGWGLAGVLPAALVGFQTGSVCLFALVWLLWFSLPLTWEFVLNRILNAVGERRLARKGS